MAALLAKIERSRRLVTARVVIHKQRRNLLRGGGLTRLPEQQSSRGGEMSRKISTSNKRNLIHALKTL